MAVAAPSPHVNGFEARLSALLGKPWFWILFCGLIAFASIARAVTRHVPPPPALKLPLAAFELTDQRGKPFGSQNLRGQVWVADFVFTSCPTACPKLTKRMALIQHRARHLGQAFHLVTITVDPENDTPQKLAAYAQSYHADPSRWSFLTGSSAELEKAVVKGFKIAMGKEESEPGSGIFSIFHGEKLVLVDGDGMIRGYYDADDAGTDDLMRDVDVLVNTR